MFSTQLILIMPDYEQKFYVIRRLDFYAKLINQLEEIKASRSLIRNCVIESLTTFLMNVTSGNHRRFPNRGKWKVSTREAY